MLQTLIDKLYQFRAANPGYVLSVDIEVNSTESLVVRFKLPNKKGAGFLHQHLVLILNKSQWTDANFATILDTELAKSQASVDATKKTDVEVMEERWANVTPAEIADADMYRDLMVLLAKVKELEAEQRGGR